MTFPHTLSDSSTGNYPPQCCASASPKEVESCQAWSSEAMFRNAKTAETDQDREKVKRPAWDFWHGWKIEEYCNQIRTDDENEAARKKAAMDHYNCAQVRRYLVGTQTNTRGLASLPRELLDIITAFLDPISEISLKLSCRDFYAGCGTRSVSNLRNQILIDDDEGVRLAWRYVSEWVPGFHHVPARQLYCCRCETQHPRRFFSGKEIIKLPTRRICEGRLRPLVVSPNLRIYFSYFEEIWSGEKPTVPTKYKHFTRNDFLPDMLPTECKHFTCNDFLPDMLPALAKLVTDGSSQLQSGQRTPLLLSSKGDFTPYLHMWCVPTLLYWAVPFTPKWSQRKISMHLPALLLALSPTTANY